MVIAFMVLRGDATTGAIVSSVIVLGRISGITSNFSFYINLYFIMRKPVKIRF